MSPLDALGTEERTMLETIFFQLYHIWFATPQEEQHEASPSLNSKLQTDPAVDSNNMDIDGHYDLDGASYDSRQGVWIASSAKILIP
jgi:hypothetical protein